MGEDVNNLIVDLGDWIMERELIFGFCVWRNKLNLRL